MAFSVYAHAADMVEAINVFIAKEEARIAKLEAKYTGIVHIGMNKHAADEARALNRMNANDGGTKSIRQRGKEQDVLTRDGRKYDLQDEGDIKDFVGTLDLDEETADKAAQILQDGGDEARDELGQILEVYTQAQKGERNMERMVLSGHSVGEEVWGDDNGGIEFEAFIKLAETFPEAAAQVEDVMVSACYAGSEQNMTRLRKAFPNAKSIMAYTGSSPGTWSGAIDHMKKWEKATEDSDSSDVDKDIAKGLRKGDNVATWNEADGYQGDEPLPYDEVLEEAEGGESLFDQYYDAKKEVSNAQSGPLRDYYNAVQAVLQHPECTGSDKKTFSIQRDLTIRLLYWSAIRKKFQGEYAERLQPGYQEAGIPMPDFSKLSRAATQKAMYELEAAAKGAEAQKALSLVEKYFFLESDIVPTTWV